MFKNLIVYRIAAGWAPTLGDIENALSKSPFTEPGATQERSCGWVPPRGEDHGALVENVAGQYILRFKSETKIIPGNVLTQRIQEKAERIEKETGRKPGKKERRELHDEAKLDLLPMAFTKQNKIWVWIDVENRALVVDASTFSKTDEVVSLLVEALPGLSLALVNTQASPQSMMAWWLTEQEPPTGFTLDRELQLKSADESKAEVKYSRHPLDIEEVKAHIQAGKLPVSLSMTWDDRVSFTLTQAGTIKKVTFLDTVFEGTKADDGGFDTDVAIATGELRKMLPELYEALGGEGAPDENQSSSDE